MFVVSTGFLSSGPWKELSEVQDPELQMLARMLPATVMGSRADSTSRKYLGAFKRWKLWARQHSLPVFPVKDINLALYLQHLAVEGGSRSAVDEAVNAMSWLHQVASAQSPSHSAIVKLTQEGLQRQLAKPIKKKQHVNKEILMAMEGDVAVSPSLHNVRLFTACLMAFAGFLRSEELISLKAADVQIKVDMMIIRIAKSKTDQLRQGDEVVIARTSSNLCPVAALEKYMQMANIQPGSDERLFRQIVKTKSGEKLRGAGGLSYTTLSENFKSKLTQLGFDVQQFGLHSLRAGGATAAARAGIADRLFKRHGRWRSESAKDGYVADTLESRLSVTKKLGL